MGRSVIERVGLGLGGHADRVERSVVCAEGHDPKVVGIYMCHTGIFFSWLDRSEGLNLRE